MVSFNRYVKSAWRPISLRSIAWLSIAMIFAPVAASDLTGIVLGPDDSRVAGVEVKLSSLEFGNSDPVILAKSSTDDQGRFRVTIPESWYETPPMFMGTLILTASFGDQLHGDQLHGGTQVVSGSPFSHHRLKIRLRRWSVRTITVVTEDDKPVAGVKLTLKGRQLPIVYPPRYSQIPVRQHSPINDPQMASSGITDEAGKVDLLLPPLEQTGSIAAEVDDGVVVTWSVVRSYPEGSNQWVESDQWTDRLVVPQLRRIPLEATFNDVEGGRVSAVSRPAMSLAKDVTVEHQFDLVRDQPVSVAVRSDAVVMLSDKTEKGSNLGVNPPFFQNTSSLKKLAVTVGKGVVVTGRVVSDDGDVVSGVRLMVMINRTSAIFSTDRDGKFEIVANPGMMMPIALGRSGYRAAPARPGAALIIPMGKESHDVGDVVLTKLSELRGVVTDAEGEPVDSAMVTATWEEPDPMTQGRGTIRREEQVRTDSDGNFLIVDVDPQATPRIGAHHPEGATEGLRELRNDEIGGPITLQLKREAAIRVTGRVLDASGNGVAGDFVSLRHRMIAPVSQAQLPNGTLLDGYRLETDGSGRFESPKTLPPWGEYIALVRDGGKDEMHSGWKTAQPDESLVLPSIESTVSSTISGRVVATSGSPIAKARVYVLTGAGQSESHSDDDGSFLIEVPPGRAPVVIAEADSHLSNGSAIKPGTKSLEIVLPREDDSRPTIVEKSDPDDRRPDAWTPEQRRDLAIRLAGDTKSADSYTKMALNAAIARYVPDNILPQLDSLPGSKTQAGQMMRASLALGLAAARLDECLEVVEQLPDGQQPIMLVQLERRVEIPRDERLRLLARIVQKARGMRDAESRVMTFGLVGERLMELGQKESGEALIREAAEDATKLAPAAYSGYARGAFAEELSVVDPEAALALIEPLTDASSYNRHLQNIAHELASVRPDLAVSLLDKMRDSDDTRRLIIAPRDAAAIRVCYRLIRVKPDKAVEVARTIGNSSIRAYCFVLMIDSLLSQDVQSDANRGLAETLHRDAWQILRRVRDQEELSKVAYLFPSTVAALLLEQTAEIDRSQLSYRVWQTIAMRRPFDESGSYAFAGFSCVCEMALAMIDVDPEGARLVANWLPSPSGGINQFSAYFQSSRSASQLIAELYPDQCEAALKAVTDTAMNNRLRLGVVQTLLRDDAARDRAKRSNFALWFPDDEDHVPVD